MNIIADLHFHSKYSRAVSKQMELPLMAEWGKKKGIDLLAIPDWTHPVWLKEVESVIEESGEGVYRVKGQPGVNFIFSSEISSIYSQGGKGRRIHNVVMAPSFAVVNKINDELKRRGCNLLSDGRPIIGLSSIQLAELIFSIDEECLLVPAHIWTPWFSMFGSKSGFDSMEECWGSYADKIYAIETGLSSSPAMNWQVGQLDNLSILSFSDAHSPAKMGREAVVFKAKSEKRKAKNADEKLKIKNNEEKKNILSSFSFRDLAGAIKQDKNSDWEIGYTIEFYPQEGKYHWTGHRNCDVSFSPADSRKKGTICPVCGKPLTVGVEDRIQALSTKEVAVTKKSNQSGLVGYYDSSNLKRPPYIMLVPLQEIIAEALQIGSTYSLKVQNMYDRLVNEVAPELELLTRTNFDKIGKTAGIRVAEGVQKVRQGDIIVQPGFDGQFGVVKIWPENIAPREKTASVKTNQLKKQMSLF